MSAYKNSYDTVIVDKAKSSEIKAVVDRIKSNKSRYQKVASELHPNAPYWFVGVIHQLEAGGKFDRHLHNGDPLSARTTRVPSGRPKTGNPPFTWEYSALDALRGQTDGDPVWRNSKDDWSMDAILLS
jgi:lysozyme family protein